MSYWDYFTTQNTFTLEKKSLLYDEVLESGQVISFAVIR